MVGVARIEMQDYEGFLRAITPAGSVSGSICKHAGCCRSVAAPVGAGDVPLRLEIPRKPGPAWFKNHSPSSRVHEASCPGLPAPPARRREATYFVRSPTTMA